jgi:hypothetical protein
VGRSGRNDSPSAAALQAARVACGGGHHTCIPQLSWNAMDPNRGNSTINRKLLSTLINLEINAFSVQIIFSGCSSFWFSAGSKRTLNSLKKRRF